MSVSRIRPLLAAITVAALLSYGLSGHALPQISSHDGMAGAAAGLCLLLVTALGYVAAANPPRGRPAFVSDTGAQYAPAPPRLPQLDGRARASPSALQRLRN
jgi:hypothetical protein